MAIRIGNEVQSALAQGRPVLALESTIVTHGLPRPRNLVVARDAEKRLRKQGVTPATIGVVKGEPVVGLSDDELTALAEDETVVKASIRDLPICAAKKLSAGTTVAATAYLANAVGIKVFSTGGLGGVHRGAATTFDESADLIALAELPIVLVSAGVKSILDIPATLERFETLNVPVVGYRTTAYHGFYVAESGHSIEYSVDSPDEIAAMARARDELGLKSALCIANPVPAERQLDPSLHAATLSAALAAADAAGVHGHDITPFLLDYMQQATEGASLDVNVAVYNGNVDLGGTIAIALSR